VLYKNKIVSDLEQCINGNYILNDELCLPLSFLKIDEQILENWFCELDNNPNELINFVEKHHSKRLGRYFENLMLFYFEFHPNIEVVEFGKQIFSGKITIGEIDFILKNKTTKEVVHLETAVKYFAKEKNKSDFYSYICPNGTRNFGDKLDKTFAKQLKITERSETIEYLKSKNIYPIKSYHFIKGILFYHIDEIKSFEHENLNISHNRGWWIYKNEVSTFSEKSKYKIVHKLKWLSKENERDVSLLLSKNEIINKLEIHFEIISQGQLIVEFVEKKDIWIEKSRGFVLDNNWP